jgi:hypothetical protein
VRFGSGCTCGCMDLQLGARDTWMLVELGNVLLLGQDLYGEQ